MIFEGVHASTIEQEILTLPITTISGETVNLAHYKGDRPIYLKFWATWCQPCRKQMPHFQSIEEEYGDKIKIIAVNLGVNEDINLVKATKKEFGLTMPIVIDTSGKLAQAFNLIGTPYHVLIDKTGNIVHKGHKVSRELDKKIQLLSSNESTDLPDITLSTGPDTQGIIKASSKKTTALFFVATWCDWYLKDSRPAMSKNCVNAQNAVNTLYQKFPQYNWTGIVSRLWTGAKELEKYRKKYNILHSLTIDTSNKAFFDYEVKDFPTLVLVKNGKEVLRINKFNNEKELSNKLKMLNL